MFVRRTSTAIFFYQAYKRFGIQSSHLARFRPIRLGRRWYDFLAGWRIDFQTRYAQGFNAKLRDEPLDGGSSICLTEAPSLTRLGCGAISRPAALNIPLDRASTGEPNGSAGRVAHRPAGPNRRAELSSNLGSPLDRLVGKETDDNRTSSHCRSGHHGRRHRHRLPRCRAGDDRH